MNKKFSKLTALILTLAMALSLVLPAWAVKDTDPPQWEEYGYSSLEELLTDWGITKEEYEAWFVQSALELEELAAQREAEAQAWQDAHPDEAAAFDPYAYFAKTYFWYENAQEYMEWMDLTEEEFRQDMFLAWFADFQYKASQKELAGGSADGINLMVNGQCVSFPDVKPELTSWRTMVPLAALVEYLGGAMTYDPASDSTQVTVGGLSFTHVIGSDTLTQSDGSTIKMDVASYVREGRTMLPAAFLAQLLDYELVWDSGYDTAVMLDRQGLMEEIDSQFTLLNRVLYAASGAGLAKEGQSLEQTERLTLDVTLFDTLHGNKQLSSKLTGSAVFNDSAAELSLSGDLSPLLDCYLEAVQPYAWDMDEDIQALRAALSKFRVDLIVNLEQGVLYLHSPSLAGLDFLPLEDPSAWIAIPVDLSELYSLSLNTLLGPLTAGQLFMASAENVSPFLAYSTITSAASELAGYVGDDRFTRSGSSYIMTYNFTEDNWDDSETAYTAALKITPSGEKSCSYALTFNVSSDDMRIDLDLTGSSGKTDLTAAFHLNNQFKFTVKGAAQTAAVSKQPLSAPPAGSKVEFPLGPTGSGSM